MAEPSTLTGSIGVFGGKFALGDALGKFGVDVRQLGVGSSYAGAFGLGDEFTPTQRAASRPWMDRIYDNFVDQVAKGLASCRRTGCVRSPKGHVWTGVQARELGLSRPESASRFNEAVEQAKALAGITGEARLKRMSPSGSSLEAVQKLLGVSASSARTLAAAAWVFGDPRAQGILDELAQARLRSQGAMVLAPTRVH